jgi:hypothetical protein
MRLIGRNDLFLLLGLTVALFAIFSGPLARVLEFVNQVEQQRGFRLLPGLVILAVVYIVHQQRKRHEMRAPPSARRPTPVRPRRAPRSWSGSSRSGRPSRDRSIANRSALLPPSTFPRWLAAGGPGR